MAVAHIARRKPVDTLPAVPKLLPPAVPNSLPISDALALSAPLASLRQRLHDSNARFALIRPHLPAALAPHVKPGPVDAEGWTLLTANAAVAAKLRQLEPRLQDVLLRGGWGVCPIRIKVLTA